MNTDGWTETQAAWSRLFPGIALVLCFLHSVLGIQRHLRRWPKQLNTISRKLWHLYKSSTKVEFAQRLRRLREWATAKQVTSAVVRDKVLQFC